MIDGPDPDGSTALPVGPRGDPAPASIVLPDASGFSLPSALVADELALVRRGIGASLADAQVEVVAEAASGREVVDLVSVHAPDLVVLGTLVDLSAPEVARRLQASARVPAMVVLLASAQRAELGQLLTLAVDALVLRTVGPLELTAVVHRVLAGEQVVVPALLAALLDDADGSPAVPGVEVAIAMAAEVDGQLLTPRERQVLVLLAEGRANREIAASLFVSLPTVKTHVAHIYAKLGARNRNEALGRAVSLGLLV